MFTGCKCTQEHRAKISKALSGRVRSKEHCENISASLTGYKQTEEHKRNTGKAVSGKKNGMFGVRSPIYKEKVPFVCQCCGKIIYLKPGRAKKRKYCSPKCHDDAGPTKETKKKLSEYQISHPNRHFKNTSIELKIEAELQKRKINYQKQVPLCNIAIVDFYLPEYKIVIQCDGCYWHNCPIHFPTGNVCRIDIDKKQNILLLKAGFTMYRFWEHDINKSSEECVNIIEHEISEHKL